MYGGKGYGKVKGHYGVPMKKHPRMSLKTYGRGGKKRKSR